MGKPTIHVRGSAAIPARPDAVEISLRVSRLAKTAGDAVEEVARDAAAIAKILDSLSVPGLARTTRGVSVSEERDHTDKGKEIFRGCRATNTIGVRVTDYTIIGDLIRDAAAQANAQIQGPTWRISPDNPARLDACRQAGEDARRRAEAYLTGLGARLGSVLSVQVTDGGGRFRNEMHEEFSHELRTPLSVIKGYAELLNAGDLDFSASVEVEFAIEAAS